MAVSINIESKASCKSACVEPDLVESEAEEYRGCKHQGEFAQDVIRGPQYCSNTHRVTH
jgi:hypothetical protein